MVLTRSCAVGLTSGGVVDIEPTEGDSVLAYYPGVRCRRGRLRSCSLGSPGKRRNSTTAGITPNQSPNPASRKNVRELLSRMDIARAHAQGFVLGL